MSDNMTQEGFASVPETQVSETTQEGQSVAQETRQPNDASSFQADYTRKYQEVAEMRKQVEAERAKFEQERAGYTRQYAPASQPVQNQPQTPDIQKTLVDQFGYEGANAIIGGLQGTQTQIQQAQFELAYMKEEMKGQQKYGPDSWDKHNYIDPVTGRQGNRVMDLRMSINPLTGKPLSLEDAWSAANPTDKSQLEKEIREKIYAELGKKAESTPASSTTVTPKAPGGKSPLTAREAFRQAMAEHN